MMITRIVPVFGLWFVLLSLSGCGLSMFASQKSPVVEDNVGKQVGTLAITTDRRVVLVRLQGDSEGGAGRFCAEPPPDAGQNITNALAAMLDVSAEKIDATIKAQLATTFASNFQAFVKRSQGLQLYRDAMYNLCQNYLNHGIEAADVQKLSKEILENSVKLIEHELTLTKGNINEPSRQSTPVPPPLAQPGNKSSKPEPTPPPGS